MENKFPDEKEQEQDVNMGDSQVFYRMFCLSPTSPLSCSLPIYAMRFSYRCPERNLFVEKVVRTLVLRGGGVVGGW